MYVMVEGLRSADPPTSSGSFPARAFSTRPDDTRVACSIKKKKKWSNKPGKNVHFFFFKPLAFLPERTMEGQNANQKEAFQQCDGKARWQARDAQQRSPSRAPSKKSFNTSTRNPDTQPASWHMLLDPWHARQRQNRPQEEPQTWPPDRGRIAS
jgi:hypothetical protein